MTRKWWLDPWALIPGFLGGLGVWLAGNWIPDVVLGHLWPWLLGAIALRLAWPRLQRRWGYPERVRKAMEHFLPGEGRRLYLVSARKSARGVWELRFRLQDPMQTANVLRSQSTLSAGLGAPVAVWLEGGGRAGMLRAKVSTVRLPQPPEKGTLRHRLFGDRPPVRYQEFYGRERPPEGELVFGIGLSTSGPLWRDMADICHLLIGGQTGTGKSVFLRQMLTWLMERYTPDQFQLVLVDLKGGVEFDVFSGVPHLGAPVVTDLESCCQAIHGLVAHFQERMELLRQLHVSNLQELRKRTGRSLPRVLVVIDEITSLAFQEIQHVSPQEGALRVTVLDHLTTLARQGRAGGVHLVVATQRPDPGVLPGQLLANFKASLAFSTRNAKDSEVILREGDGSAAWLPPIAGRGVFLYGSQHDEIQVPFIDAVEIDERLCRRWKRKVVA
ncbi:MAG TPA: FtsK/SpoIIIE domain-containing protein [Candidatus Dormibacteraeota bacterium]|jgi:DNA segregation ATPase FtsK/SpoIIIE-like protein|nr:FtsK/SpoIIIE domain-containing protein [Candidatus Dormibacteraeota bacterium]